MNYEEMSDFEVNKLVAERHLKLFVDESRSGGRIDSDVWLIDSEGLLRYTNYNPCNNPSDAWPIIVANKINIEWRDSLKVPPLAKGTGGNQCWHADKNPLRAAMICFLKMKELEK